jgi:putative oxidoreductase
MASSSGGSAVADFGLAVLRVSGVLLATHGFDKVFGGAARMDGFAKGIDEMGFPVPVVWAWAAALSELVGGAFVALGLFTRLAAFFAAATMFVAAFIRHAPDPFAKKELALLYLLVMVALVCLGGGRFSVDGLWRKKS